MLSFAQKVKNELARSPLAKSCCSRAEVKAFLQVNGFLEIGVNTRKLLIHTEYAPVARRLFLLSKHAYKITPGVLTCRKTVCRKRTAFLSRYRGRHCVKILRFDFTFLLAEDENC